MKKAQSSELANPTPGELHRLVLRRAWKSFVSVSDDAQLRSYIENLVSDVARECKKDISDVSISDIKQLVDYVHGLLERLNLESVTLKKVIKLADLLSVSAEGANILSFSEAMAGLVQGNFGWLAWHITKNVGSPLVKRAATVYLAGQLAIVLYGHVIPPDDNTDEVIDPIFESMDLETLTALAKILDISPEATETEESLAARISKRLSSEGKQQSLTRAWFPSDARSYMEVLVVVAKECNVDIRGLVEVGQIEAAICGRTFAQLWSKLSSAEQEEFARRWVKQSSSFSPAYISSLAGLGAIGAAQMSGFGVYMTASTVVGFASNAIGFTLPFAFYTGMSQTICALVGPGGMAIAALPTIFELMRAKPERLVGAVALIATWRTKLAEELAPQTTKSRKAFLGWLLGAAMVGVGAAAVIGYACGLLVFPH